MLKTFNESYKTCTKYENLYVNLNEKRMKWKTGYGTVKRIIMRLLLRLGMKSAMEKLKISWYVTLRNTLVLIYSVFQLSPGLVNV